MIWDPQAALLSVSSAHGFAAWESRDALVSAVVLSNMTIMPPAILPQKHPETEMNIVCDKGGYKNLMARRIDSCTWKYSSQDTTILDFKGTEAITEEVRDPL